MQVSIQFFECVKFTPINLNKDPLFQTRLHETVCGQRKAATIASHDLAKIPKGTLSYTTLPTDKLLIKPIGRAKEMSGKQYYALLRKEAEEFRKEKKRKTLSGIHKYVLTFRK